jgi:hypothetical protein
MKPADVYVDLDGNVIALAGLDGEERRLVARLLRRARTNPDWNAFDNYWTVAVPAFYQARGVARKAVTRTIAWRIAQDQSGRLGIAAGLVRPDDCGGDLEDLIREQFGSAEAFARATGLAEEPLRQFLAGAGDLSLTALEKGLQRIGYSLRVRPLPAEVQHKKGAKARVG